MNDISIDLETLGTRYDAPILSIGATVFDRETGATGESLYQIIDLEDALTKGTLSASTLKWWMGQSQGAKDIFTSKDCVSLDTALLTLNSLVRVHSPGVCVWGNGATFDITILEHAYAQCNLAPLWAFWCVRDMRTIVDAAGLFGFDKTTVPFEGTQHNALHDAQHQAKVIAACWRTIAGGSLV